MPSYRSTLKKNHRNNEKSLETILNLYTIATSKQHFKFYIKQLHIDRYFLQPQGLQYLIKLYLIILNSVFKV